MDRKKVFILIDLTPESDRSAHRSQCPTRVVISDLHDNAIFLRIVKIVLKARTSCDLDELTKEWFGPGESQNVLFSDKNRVK